MGSDEIHRNPGAPGGNFGGNSGFPNWNCPQMPLSATAIRNAKPGAKAKRMFDSQGLYLEVAPTGGKWWRLKFRFGGKERRLGA